MAESYRKCTADEAKSQRNFMYRTRITMQCLMYCAGKLPPQKPRRPSEIRRWNSLIDQYANEAILALFKLALDKGVTTEGGMNTPEKVIMNFDMSPSDVSKIFKTHLDEVSENFIPVGMSRTSYVYYEKGTRKPRQMSSTSKKRKRSKKQNASESGRDDTAALSTDEDTKALATETASDEGTVKASGRGHCSAASTDDMSGAQTVLGDEEAV